jgi:hypothetical protein
MKKIQIALILALACITNTFAQSKFVVNEVRQFMSKGEQNGFEIILTDVNKEKLVEAFEKKIKKYNGKITSSKKNPESFVDNAKISTVSANTVDLYYYVSPVGTNGTKLTVFVDLGGAFISSAGHAQAFAAMENELKMIAKEATISIIDEQIKTEEKNQKKLEDEFKDLVKNKENYIKEIEKAKALIAQREADIVKNEQDQATKTQQIDIQKQIVETVKQKKNSVQ